MIETIQETVRGEAKPSPELEEHRWAVLSFERCEAGNLTYSGSVAIMADLETNGVTGLCIVTDQTAARLAA